jgi:hypothetical protein
MELYKIYREGKYLGAVYLELPAEMIEPLLILDTSDLMRLMDFVATHEEEKEKEND